MVGGPPQVNGIALGSLEWHGSMLLPSIGREVASFGIGLDVSGAIFLGVSLLRSPVGTASLLFDNPSFAGKKAVSELPVREAVESCSRVGSE